MKRANVNTFFLSHHPVVYAYDWAYVVPDKHTSTMTQKISPINWAHFVVHAVIICNSERELLSRNYVAWRMWKIINTGVTTYKCHYNVNHVRFLWNTTPSNTMQYHHRHHSRTAIYENKLLNNVKSSYGFALWFVNMVFILLLIK